MTDLKKLVKVHFKEIGLSSKNNTNRTKVSTKINSGNFFEDFKIGQKIKHPLPRTITDGDVSFYIALTGSRFALHNASCLAKEFGYKRQPIDDLLMFHLTFWKVCSRHLFKCYCKSWIRGSKIPISGICRRYCSFSN